MIKTFSTDNEQFLSQMAAALSRRQFDNLIVAMKHVIQKVFKKSDISDDLIGRWKELIISIEDATVSLKRKHLSFAFVEGELVTAVREGDWLLLDEINLAPAELLESISGWVRNLTIFPSNRHNFPPVAY